jgi:hypothetical protein
LEEGVDVARSNGPVGPQEAYSSDLRRLLRARGRPRNGETARERTDKRSPIDH